MAKAPKKTRVKLVDATPTWESLVPLFSEWIDRGSDSQKEYVKEELLKLARAVDAQNAKNKRA